MADRRTLASVTITLLKLAVVAEVCRVLRPGGTVVIDTINATRVASTPSWLVQPAGASRPHRPSPGASSKWA